MADQSLFQSSEQRHALMVTIFFTALLVVNLLCGVIPRPFILQRYSADALTFGLLLVDIFGGYALVVLFARIWIAKRRVRQLEAQSQEKIF